MTNASLQRGRQGRCEEADESAAQPERVADLRVCRKADRQAAFSPLRVDRTQLRWVRAFRRLRTFGFKRFSSLDLPDRCRLARPLQIKLPDAAAWATSYSAISLPSP